MKHYQNPATGERFSSNYLGRHKEGVGLIPLGDRHRADTERFAYYFTGVLEERDSDDSYSKFYK